MFYYIPSSAPHCLESQRERGQGNKEGLAFLDMLLNRDALRGAFCWQRSIHD